jgi:HSP20 family protein
MVTGEHKEEKKEDKDEQGHKYHFVERRSGSFSRTVPLPAAVKEDKVTADCKDGVLTITMPKKEEAKPHKVKITSK